MDSCYSGKWCYTLHEMKVKGISVIASSADDQISRDTKTGGMFYNSIFELNEKYNNDNFDKLVRINQHPICSISGG